MRSVYYLVFLVILISSCGDEPKPDYTTPKASVKVDAPTFNSDSAYYFIEKQVEFGPRVPNTPAHETCKNWLVEKLETYTDKVYQQRGTVKAYNGVELNFTNIIGSFNPATKKRILLCAHWDTRPYGDHDDNPDNWEKPIDGANDGGSGVGVLLEIARQISLNKPELGIDIILFDVEDYGQPEFSKSPSKPDTYALGSQYWSKKPHVQSYNAKYGILLDMVGAKNSTFRMEANSYKYAQTALRKVWEVGVNSGYSNYFLYDKVGPIQDDHYYINVIKGIPTIDIININPQGEYTFHPTWHTHDDNMDVIDKKVLEAVGQTVLEVVFREEAGVF